MTKRGASYNIDPFSFEEVEKSFTLQEATARKIPEPKSATTGKTGFITYKTDYFKNDYLPLNVNS